MKKTWWRYCNVAKIFFLYPACFSGDRLSQLSCSFGSLDTPTRTTCPATNVVVRNIYAMLVTWDLMNTRPNHRNNFSGYSQVLAFISYQLFFETYDHCG
jgi:hypothetical protein